MPFIWLLYISVWPFALCTHQLTQFLIISALSSTLSQSQAGAVRKSRLLFAILVEQPISINCRTALLQVVTQCSCVISQCCQFLYASLGGAEGANVCGDGVLSVYIFVCLCVCSCMHVCVCVCVHVCIHTNLLH